MKMDNEKNQSSEISNDIDLTVDELNARVDMAERWRQQIVNGALTFANDGLKSLIYLNGGTVVALPALKGLANNLNFEDLRTSVILFLIGLISAAIAQFLAYFAMSSGAYIHLYGGRYWQAIKEIKLSKHELTVAHSYKQKRNLHEKRTAKQEIAVLICAGLALSCFISGGFMGVAAFYSSE